MGIFEKWYEAQQRKIDNLVELGVITDPAYFNRSAESSEQLSWEGILSMNDVINNLHHLMEETHEALTVLPLRRNYKKDHDRILQPEEIKHLAKEMVDIGCFLINGFILCGLSLEQISQVLEEILQNNSSRNDHVGN